jgi:hypothetical protein
MITNLPTMAQLEKGVVIKGPVSPTSLAGKHRHLEAAGVFDSVELRIRVEHQPHVPGVDSADEDSEVAELLSMRRATGFGTRVNPKTGKREPCAVVCPGCEETDDDETCPLCEGSGLVAVEVWDRWFEEERGCTEYYLGCEKDCTRGICPHDELNCAVDLPVLLLESRKLRGDWKAQGNSVVGFKLKGLAFRPSALHRFLSLVAVGAGFGLVDDAD